MKTHTQNTSLDPKHVGIAWVYGYTGIPHSTIRRMADGGSIPARKIGGRWRFETERVKNWFESSQNKYR